MGFSLRVMSSYPFDSMTSLSNYSRGVQNDISHTGFRPQLYTVVGGSYASNSVYGSGAALVHDYNTEIIQSASRSSIRQHDTQVEYDIKIILDLHQADPAFDTEEVRIRTLQPLIAGEPGCYLTRLPIKPTNYRQPLFLDVEIVNPATGKPFAGFPATAGVGQLQARLLINGDMALVTTNLAAGPPPTVTPLTGNDFDVLFGAAAGTELEISVRGSYRSQNEWR